MPPRGRTLRRGSLGSYAELCSPGDAVNLGIALVPEDRKLPALILRMGVRENLSLPMLDRLGSSLFPSRRQERLLVGEYIQRLSIRTPHLEQSVATLSEGNQQKVVIARWLATKPKVLILDEPTRGIDVEAKAEVHALIARLAEVGVAILIVSSELPEILGMSHRVLVMREGRIVADIPLQAATEEGIVARSHWAGLRIVAGVSLTKEQAYRSGAAGVVQLAASATWDCFARRSSCSLAASAPLRVR